MFIITFCPLLQLIYSMSVKIRSVMLMALTGAHHIFAVETSF